MRTFRSLAHSVQPSPVPVSTKMESQDFTVTFDYLLLVLRFPCYMSFCLSHLVKCSQVTRTWTWLWLAWQVVTKETRKAVQGLPTQSDLPCPSNLSILQVHYLVWGTIHKMFTYFLLLFTHWYKTTWKKLFLQFLILIPVAYKWKPCKKYRPKISFHCRNRQIPVQQASMPFLHAVTTCGSPDLWSIFGGTSQACANALCFLGVSVFRAAGTPKRTNCK